VVVADVAVVVSSSSHVYSSRVQVPTVDFSSWLRASVTPSDFVMCKVRKHAQPLSESTQSHHCIMRVFLVFLFIVVTIAIIIITTTTATVTTQLYATVRHRVVGICAAVENGQRALHFAAAAAADDVHIAVATIVLPWSTITTSLTLPQILDDTLCLCDRISIEWHGSVIRSVHCIPPQPARSLLAQLPRFFECRVWVSTRAFRS
jgi:hypothetical protein